MKQQRLICPILGLIDGFPGRDAAGKVGEGHPVITGRLFVYHGDVIGHGSSSYLNLTPDCRSMLRSVLAGISFSGWGTVTRPGFAGCLNWTWEPLCPTRYQPSASRRRTISRLSMCNYTHCQ